MKRKEQDVEFSLTTEEIKSLGLTWNIETKDYQYTLLNKKLPFHNHCAIVYESADDFKEEVERILPGIEAAYPRSASFNGIGAVVQIDDFSLGVHSHDEYFVQRKTIEDTIAIVIPFDGGVDYFINEKKISSKADINAVFLSGNARTEEMGKLCQVLIPLNKQRLLEVTKRILSFDDLNFVIDVENDREIPLKVGKYNFYEAFKGIFNLIDNAALAGLPTNTLAIDELIYRTAALMLLPVETLNKINIDSKNKYEGSGVKELNDAIDNYLTQKENTKKSDMEILAHFDLDRLNALAYKLKKETFISILNNLNNIDRTVFIENFKLTKREMSVLKLLTEGINNAEIASALFISEHTVARHLQSIYQKLNVTSRLKAIRVTQKFGIFGKR